jgi:hypothetical protein
LPRCFEIKPQATDTLDNSDGFLYKRLVSCTTWLPFVILTLIFFPLTSLPQNSSVERKLGKDFWAFGVDAGVTIFFGDIDEGVAKDQFFKNNYAFSVNASRNFKSLISLNGQLTFGRISGEKNQSSNNYSGYVYFINNFSEYSFTAGINLMALIMRDVNTRLGIYAQSGFGLISFKTRLYNGENDTVVKSLGYGGQERTTELVIPLELKISYNLSQNSALYIQTALNRVDTDKIDATEGNDNRDYYDYISLGYTYKIYSNKNRSITRKNSKGIRYTK